MTGTKGSVLRLSTVGQNLILFPYTVDNGKSAPFVPDRDIGVVRAAAGAGQSGTPRKNVAKTSKPNRGSKMKQKSGKSDAPEEPWKVADPEIGKAMAFWMNEVIRPAMIAGAMQEKEAQKWMQ